MSCQISTHEPLQASHTLKPLLPQNRNSAASNPISSRRRTAEPRYRPKGSVTADTVCSAQRSFEVYQQHWRQQRQQQKKGQRRNRRTRCLPRSCSTNDEVSKAMAATNSSLRGPSNDYGVRAGPRLRPSQRQLHPHGALTDRYSRTNLPIRHDDGERGNLILWLTGDSAASS